MIEIERKFLVCSKAYKDEASTIEGIRQGFLNSHPERTVRIRLKDAAGYITVKGISNKEGTSRFEWEKEISHKEAQQLFAICEGGIIRKTRYAVTVGKHIFEVDEFHDKNQGLVIAEIELSDAKEAFEKPKWLGKEVTGNIKYYNSQLCKHPYISWKTKDKL